MRLTRIAVLALVALFPLTALAAPAAVAGPSGSFEAGDDGKVTVIVVAPGTNGSASNTSGGGGSDGTTCNRVSYGVIEGHENEVMYACVRADGSTFYTWVANDGAGPANQVTPAQAAQRVVNSMQLLPINLRVNLWYKNSPSLQEIRRKYGRGTWRDLDPDALGWGLVNMPVIFNAKDPNANTWGPISTSAAAAGLEVKVTAKVDKVVYFPGDGKRKTVTCTTPSPAMHIPADLSVPYCGYRYINASYDEPGMVFTVTAVTYWTAHWTAGGQSGDIPLTRTATTKIAIGESQALVCGNNGCGND